MAFRDGWVKIHRHYIDSDVFLDADLWQLFTYCLMKANFSEQIANVRTGIKMKKIKVGVGQFVYGRNASAEEIGQKPSSLYKRMKRLEEIGVIKIEPNTHFSIVTVLQWDEYKVVTNDDKKEKDDCVAGVEQGYSRDVADTEQGYSRDVAHNKKDKESTKKDKEDKYDSQARDVFYLWCSLESTVHHNDSSFDSMKKRIISKIKKYSLDEVLSACKYLNDACLDDTFYYNWKWSLEKFMTQKNGISNWVNGGDMLTKYHDSLSSIKATEEKKKADNVRSELGSACDGVSDGVLAMVRFE